MIAPKREGRVIGDLDVEIFLLLVSVVLERADDELELILIVVIPLITTSVGAKEKQLELFYIEIDVSLLEQKVSKLLKEMHMHEEGSSS